MLFSLLVKINRKNMTAKIYRPAKNAMQSGKGKTKIWMLEYAPEQKKTVDKLIGWQGSGDMKQQIKLKFESREAAISYAEKNNIPFTVIEPKERIIKAQSYADNFIN